MNSNCIAVSNNSLVWDHAGGQCIKVDGSSLEVLYECLNFVANGGSLYTHPVSGNARLIHNPFRTVIVEEKRRMPMKTKKDIEYLEFYLELMENSGESVPLETMNDYKIVDYELYLSAMGKYND